VTRSAGSQIVADDLTGIQLLDLAVLTQPSRGRLPPLTASHEEAKPWTTLSAGLQLHRVQHK